MVNKKYIWKAKYYYLFLRYKIKLKVMSTRSLIGIKLKDNIVKTIYCHWDGYPEHNGRLLIENYNTPTSIMGLMELGDLSFLAESPDQCKAYYRDRNEPWDAVKSKDRNASEIMNLFKRNGVDYIYIYNEEFEWDCFKYNGTQINILDSILN